MKCIDLGGEYVESVPSLVTAACFLPGRAKYLSAPLRIFKLPIMSFVFRSRVLWPLEASDFQWNSSYVSTALETDVLSVIWVRIWWGFVNPWYGDERGNVSQDPLIFYFFLSLSLSFSPTSVAFHATAYYSWCFPSVCVCLFSLYVLHNCFSLVMFLYIHCTVSAYGEIYPPGAEPGGTVQL